jgi:hypothetical protein
MLAFPLVRKKTEDNGQTVIFEPVKFTMGTVTSLLNVANKTGRMAANIPPEIDDDATGDDFRDLLFESPGQVAAAAPPASSPKCLSKSSRNPPPSRLPQCRAMAPRSNPRR